MGIKIKLKKPKVLVNSKSDKNPPHGQFTINKGVYIPLEKDKRAVDYPEHRIYVLKPVIDKLVLRYTPFTNKWSDEEKDTFKKYVFSYLHPANDEDWDYQYVPNSEQIKNSKLYWGYKRNLWLWHKPTGQKITVQVDPYKEHFPFFKFTLNPTKLGKKGLEFFKQEVFYLFGANDYDMGYHSILKAPKAVQRMDVAVDIVGADISDMEIIYHPHGNQKEPVKPSKIFGVAGRLESNYPNAAVEGSKNVYIYNKKQEILDNKEDKKPLYGEALCTRYEYRYMNWKKPLSYLLEIKPGYNPLKWVNIKWINYPAFSEKDFTHVQFMLSAAARGKEKALEVIPDKRKEEYAHTYETAFVDIWDIKEIWKYWPDVVKGSGLLDE